MTSRELDKHAAIELLFVDLRESKSALEKSDTQINRRNYVRNVYAGIEALTNWLKQLALQAHTQSAVAEWNAADLAMLREENYYLDEKGVARTQAKFLPTDVNLKFVIQLFQKFTRPTYTVDWSSGDWRDLKLGLKIRHRITHPKDLGTLQVTDAEINSVKNAHAFAVKLFFQPAFEYIKERDRRTRKPAEGAPK